MIRAMKNATVFLPFLALAAIGAGCLKPLPPAPTPTLEPPAAAAPSDQPPCLAFNDVDGFARWIDAYANGEDETARSLARQVGLPERAEPKLVADLRNSLSGSAKPSFLCTLDERGQNVAWVTENWIGAGRCHDTFYVSINGVGTVSDFTADGRVENCDRLCAPKRQNPDTLVWQCDLVEKDGNKAWTQLQMNRATGEVEPLPCKQDALGTAPGCAE